MNFYDDQAKTDRRAVRAVLPRPRRRRPAADGADHLRQRLDARRPGDHLRHRVLELHAKGVYTFQGGTDQLIGSDARRARKNGVDVRIRCLVERIEVDSDRRVTGVVVNGQRIGCRAVVSNANLKTTVLKLVGREHFDRDFRRGDRGGAAQQQQLPGLHRAQAGRRASITLRRPAVPLPSTAGSTSKQCSAARSAAARSRSIIPARARQRPLRRRLVDQRELRGLGRTSDAEYIESTKRSGAEPRSIASNATCPNIREMMDHVEASTPRTFEHYTRHLEGASFGTKFEGLKVSSRSPADRRPVPRRFRGNHHVRLAGGDELRGDRRQRCRQAADTRGRDCLKDVP